MRITIRRSVAFMGLALVAGVSAEAAARLDDWIRLGIPFRHTPDYDRDLKYRDWFGVRGKPNGRYRRWHLDSTGFRGPDVARARTAGCTRTMLLGASETLGLYEPDGQEYSAQLQDSLRNRGCYEVLNAGVAGMGLKAIIRYWEDYGAAFKPDFVIVYPSPIFYLSTNESTWPPVLRGPEPSSELPFRPRLIETMHNVWATPDFIQVHRVDRWISRDRAGKPADWMFRSIPADRLNGFMTDLDSLVRSIRARRATPVVMTHAIRFGNPVDPRDAFELKGWNQFTPRATAETMLAFEHAAATAMRADAARNHIALVDLDSALTGRRELFGDAIHFLQGGSAIVAGMLARVLNPSPAEDDHSIIPAGSPGRVSGSSPRNR